MGGVLNQKQHSTVRNSYPKYALSKARYPNVLPSFLTRVWVCLAHRFHLRLGPKGTLVLRERLKLPLKWVSIEGLDDKIFGEASDCWSFGVLMWEVLSYGAMPYADTSTAKIQERVRAGLRLQMYVSVFSKVHIAQSETGSPSVSYAKSDTRVRASCVALPPLATRLTSTRTGLLPFLFVVCFVSCS